MRSIGVMLVCLGCHAGGILQPDSGIVPDGSGPGLGMSVIWDADPALPGSVTDRVTVTDADFQIDHLQLLSDAGADDRTIHSSYQLRWSASTTPSPEMFPDAPVAVYQKISLDLRPGFRAQYAYEIQGTWRDSDDDLKPFKIVDTMGLSIPIECSVVLHAGDRASIEIRVDLRDALDNVDFAHVNEQDGVRLLAGGPQLADFHGRMMRAFKLEE